MSEKERIKVRQERRAIEAKEYNDRIMATANRILEKIDKLYDTRDC